MRHIKKFEEHSEEDILHKVDHSNKPNFKIGDYVYCIAPVFELKKDHKYKVTDLYKDVDDYVCQVNDDIDYCYYCTRFVNEIEYKALKYNL